MIWGRAESLAFLMVFRKSLVASTSTLVGTLVMRSKGVTGCRPYSGNKESLGLISASIFCTKIQPLAARCPDCQLCTHIISEIDSRMQLSRSVCPSVLGWKAVDILSFTPMCVDNALQTFPVNLWS